MSENSISLPTNRAFVIQLHGNSVGSRDHHRGRVEHLASGQAARFADEEEFWAFVDNVLVSACSNQNEPAG